MADVLERESDDSDEDSCSDADSNEEESTSLPRQETDIVAQSGIQVKRSEIQREQSVKRNKEPQNKGRHRRKRGQNNLKNVSIYSRINQSQGNYFEARSVAVRSPCRQS